MWEPKLSNIRRQQLGMVRFGGINYTENYAVGELADAKNLTTDHYPFLSQRKPRQVVKTFDGVTPVTMTVKNDKVFAAVELPKRDEYDKAKGYVADDLVSVGDRDYRCIKEQKETEEYSPDVEYKVDDQRWHGEQCFVCLFDHTPTATDSTPESSPYWLSISPGNEEYWKEEVVGKFLWDDEEVGSYYIRGEKQIVSQLNRLVVFPDYMIFDADKGTFENYLTNFTFPRCYFYLSGNTLSVLDKRQCGYKYRGEYDLENNYEAKDVVFIGEEYFIAAETSGERGELPNDTTGWEKATEVFFEEHLKVFVEKIEPFERTLRIKISGHARCFKNYNVIRHKSDGEYGFSHDASSTHGGIGFLIGENYKGRRWTRYVASSESEKTTFLWRDEELCRIIVSGSYVDKDGNHVNSMEEDIEITYRSVLMQQVEYDLRTIFKTGQQLLLSGASFVDDGTERQVTIKSVSRLGIELEGLDSFEGNLETGEISVKNNIPSFDCVCAHNNRVYGASGDTIYISALGNPLDFYNYNGLSTGSHSMRISGEGAFTGCIGYGSFVAFFKEREVIKVYGNAPENFQINSATMTGVEKGSAKSLCIVEGTLFYKAPTGIFAYTGGLHYTISSNFGIRSFKNAVAGTDGRRYYVSMTDEQNLPSLFVYDTLTKLWTREDDSKVLDFCVADGTMHMLAGQEVWQLRTESEERIEWSATLCPIVQETPLAKAYQRLMIRLETGADSLVNVELRTDNELTWKKVWGYSAKGKRVVDVPITVRRCDSLEVRISGVGECMIKGLFIDGKTGGRL